MPTRAATDVLVGVATLAPALLRAAQLDLLSSAPARVAALPLAWYVVLALIACNYLMHAWIWCCPQHFARCCRGAEPVRVFSRLEMVHKLSQLVAVATLASPAAVAEAARRAPWWCWAVGAGFVAAGQTLNLGTYAAIGDAGVYYGFKLGRTVPWCTGFPFNAGLRHPQYVGVVLTLAGGLCVLQSAALAARGIDVLLVLWITMYLPMAALEQAGDQDSKGA